MQGREERERESKEEEGEERRRAFFSLPSHSFFLKKKKKNLSLQIASLKPALKAELKNELTEELSASGALVADAGPEPGPIRWIAEAFSFYRGQTVLLEETLRDTVGGRESRSTRGNAGRRARVGHRVHLEEALHRHRRADKGGPEVVLHPSTPDADVEGLACRGLGQAVWPPAGLQHHAPFFPDPGAADRVAPLGQEQRAARGPPGSSRS